MTREAVTRAEIDDAICDILIKHGPDGHVDGHEYLTEYVMKALTQAAAPERERCARIAEEDDGPDNPDIVYNCECGDRIAAKIRSGER